VTTEPKALSPEIDAKLVEQAESYCGTTARMISAATLTYLLRTAALVAVEGMTGPNHPLANVYKCSGKQCQAVWIKRPIGREDINSNEAGHHGWEHDGEKWLCPDCTGRYTASEAQVELLKDENERLQAELAALRKPVYEKTTVEEAKSVIDAWKSFTLHEVAMRVTCGAIDDIIAKRLPQDHGRGNDVN
jgi:hypothetical protein